MSDFELPKPEEIKKEFEEFVQKRFGKQVQVVASSPGVESEESEVVSKSSSEPDRTELNFDYLPKDIKKILDVFPKGKVLKNE